MILDFLSKKYKLDEQYRNFKSEYFNSSVLGFCILLVIGQLAYVIRDSICFDFSIYSVLLRNIDFVVIPFFVYTLKYNKKYNWVVAIIAIWLNIIGSLILNSFFIYSPQYTGIGFIIYFIFFFMISIFSLSQVPIYISYMALPILLLLTSEEYFGRIHYGNSVWGIIFISVLIMSGLITISMIIRTLFIKLYKREQVIKELSYIDHLTKCYNRHKLDIITDSNYSLRSESTLFVVDIDNLKKANTDYGHLGGDEMIMYISSVLKDSIRLKDIIIRYGGDEFIIIFDGLIDEEAVYSRIRDNLKIDNKYNATVSIGTTRVLSDNLNLKSAIQRADIALYQSKTRKNTMTIFENLSNDLRVSSKA